MKLDYLSWLQKEKTLYSVDGKDIEIYRLNYSSDESVLSEWAKHFREQYCLDSDIDKLRSPSQSRKEYLNQIKFPDKKNAPGPSIRAGDFAEIVVADYLEYRENYWVPRTRYNNKTIRNESTKGCDVIGFKFVKKNGFSGQDSLIIFEVKAEFTESKKNIKRLQDAVKDSDKDYIRKGESLNAIKQRFLNDTQKKDSIERFQDEVDRPYKQIYGAATFLDEKIFYPIEILKTDSSKHTHSNLLKLLVITGTDMMALVNAIYERAADEA